MKITLTKQEAQKLIIDGIFVDYLKDPAEKELEMRHIEYSSYDDDKFITVDFGERGEENEKF